MMLRIVTVIGLLPICFAVNSANVDKFPLDFAGPNSFAYMADLKKAHREVIAPNLTQFWDSDADNGTENYDSTISTVVTELVSDRSINAKFFEAYPVENWKSLGYLTNEFMKEINPHWLDYPPPSHRSFYMFSGIYLTMAVIGLSGNALVIFMILSFRSLRTPSNILIMNLALSDFVMMSKTPIFVYNSLYFGPALGALGCHLYGFTGGLSGTASIMTLAAVALDRYHVIAYPLDPAHKITKITAVIWIILIWMYSSLFASLPLFSVTGVSQYVPEGYLTSCSFDYLSETTENRIFIFSFFIGAWFVPFSVITFSYAGICRAVFMVGMKRRGQEKAKRKRELKLALVVILVIVMWFVSWTPYAVVALLGILGQKHLITPLVSMIPAIFCKTAACTNPFVYSLNHPRLRQELFKLLCRKRYAMERTWRSTWKTHSSVNNYRSSIRREGSCNSSVINRNSTRRNSATIELKNIKMESEFSSV